MDTATSLLITVIVILTVYVLLFKRKTRNAPPGPKGYPLIGSTFSIDAKNLHISLTELVDKYGEIYEIDLFGQTVVVLNSPRLIREAFLQEPNASLFANRVEGSLTREIYHGLVDVVFSLYNKPWVKRRKLSFRVLKAFGEGMRSIEANIQKLLQFTVGDMRKQVGKSFDPEKFIDAFLVQLMAILMTGRQHDMDSAFIKGVIDHENTLNKVLAQEISLVVDWLPFMRYVPSPISRRYHDFKKCQKRFEELMIIENKTGSSRGMIHELFSEMNKVADTGGEKWLTEDSVQTILSNMVGGGILTSKGTIGSGIHILLHRKDVQEKLQAEVDEAVGSDRQPSLSDKEFMPYTEAFILEILRLISHLPFLVPHCVSADTQLAGYDIKKGSMVLPNVWNVHHDSTIYADPYQFKPERFLDQDGSLLPADHPLRQCMLAFGIGKRSCIGEAFAKNRLFLFFSTLMQQFSFLPDENGKSEKFDPRNMEVLIINMPKGFKCRITERKTKRDT